MAFKFNGNLVIAGSWKSEWNGDLIIAGTISAQQPKGEKA